MPTIRHQQLIEALAMQVDVIDTAMRGTGRTEFLIDEVREGDTILCTREEYRSLTQRLKHRNKSVRVFEVDPKYFFNEGYLQFRERSRGAVHYSHDFFRQYLKAHLYAMGRRIQVEFNDLQGKNPTEITPTIPEGKSASSDRDNNSAFEG